MVGALLLGLLGLTSPSSAADRVGDDRSAVAQLEVPAMPVVAQAANALACPEMTDSIDRLYSAYFLRSPDQAGLNFWVDEFATGRWDMESMSSFFAGSDEFVARYSTLTNAQFVELIYRNVLGRPAEPSGFNFWVGRLDSGEFSRGRVMLLFSESKEYVLTTGTEPPLAGYFSWYPAGTVWTCGTGSFATAAEHPYVDVYGVNRGGSTANWEAWLLDGSGTRLENLLGRDLAPSSFAFFWSANLASPAPTRPITGIEVVGSQQTVTIVVRSPAPLAVDRADWSALAG